jgi:hypothetical protein
MIYLHPFIKEKKRKKRMSKLRNFVILGTLVNTWVPHISYLFKNIYYFYGGGKPRRVGGLQAPISGFFFP